LTPTPVAETKEDGERFVLTGSNSLPAYYRELKKYHLQHHFADYENGFGVTSRFWDRVFKTELPESKVLKMS